MKTDELSLESDSEPEFDDDGYTSLLNPEEDGEAFEGLVDSGLSEQEAQETVDFMRPLSDDEEAILEEHPELEGLTRVDDAEQEEWLGQKFSEGTKAMDRVLEDASYGDDDMYEEETMERHDTDSGWGLKKAFRKIKRGVRKAGRGVGKVARSPFKLVKKFVPNRDKQKAKLVRNLYRKLWFEHANWLAQQDKNAGVALKTRAEYERIAKLWARSEIAKQKLPVKYAVSGSTILGAEILGADLVGAWWNPFSWFQSRANVVLNNTTGERSDQAPDEQASQVEQPGDMSTDVQDTSDQQSSEETSDEAGDDVEDTAATLPPEYRDAYRYAAHLARAREKGDGKVAESCLNWLASNGWRVQLPKASDSFKAVTVSNPKYPKKIRVNTVSGDDLSGWKGDRQVRSRQDPIADSLGAFAAHVLGKDLPAKDNPSVDEIVRGLVAKLKTGQAISPGEVGLLSSAAREGNEGARRVVTVLRARGAVVSGDDSGLDPWMYKLNPTYWIASKRKREFVDKEKKAWKENAALREQLEKQQRDLDAAERASRAAEAVEQARTQASETEAKLQAIASSLKGDVAGSFVGHEKPTPISSVVRKALEETGKLEAAERLYAKVREGQPLSGDELREARQVARLVGRVRVVHGDLMDEAEKRSASSVQGAFVGACALGGIAAALDQNSRHLKAANYFADRVASGKPLQQGERDGLATVLRGQQKLREFTASLVSGRALAGCPKSWKQGAFVGAARAMSDEDKKMLSSIVKLAKVGNPRAQKALAVLRKTGEVSGGDSVGLSLSKAFKYATAPIWLPAKGIAKGAKWVGKKTGIVSSKASPEKVRLNRLKAAQKRASAAAARARAADSQNEAEYRAQQAIAAAADAEADAQDAEATAREQAMRTAEVEAAPNLQADDSESSDDASQGEFAGAWTSFLGKDTRGAKSVAKAREKSPAGQKVRGAAVVYRRAKAGDPKSIKAIRVMVAKAKQGDQQALRDVNAVKVARQAYVARKEARKAARRGQRRDLVAKIRAARRAKVVAVQKSFEARAAERLARMSRKRELQKLARVERKASAGNAKARKFVAQKVAASRKGDKRARAQVEAMKLARVARRYQQRSQRRSTWRAERQNLKAARYLARGILANKPGAIRQYAVIKDAAASGNPNAQRGLERIALQLAVLRTIQTGVVAMPRKQGEKPSGRAGKPVPGTPQFAAVKKQVEAAREQARAGTATREELVANARRAEQVGDLRTASSLAMASSSAPSATEGVKRAASQVKAAEAGNPEARAKLDQDLAAARGGNPDAVNKLGQVAAARTVEAVEQGKPVPQPMRDAINLQERARAGDPSAQATLQRVSEAATAPEPPPEATAAAVYATGASALASSLASKPQARRELMERVNAPVPPAEQSAAQAQLAAIVQRTEEGTATPEEGERGIQLAMRLHKPRVAALISAKAPPLDVDAMSSLPDQPLPPIAGAWELFKATLAALSFSTRDPLGNYREGIAARSRETVTTSGSCEGWSPFSFFTRFKSALPALAMLSAPVTAAASVASLTRGRKGPPAPAKPAAAAATAAPAKTASSEIPNASSTGNDKTFKDLIAKALKDKKMSRDDFNRAAASHVDAKAPREIRETAAAQVLKFLEKNKVKVG